jgi:GNAT superfamily N-acetyltransferase
MPDSAVVTQATPDRRESLAPVFGRAFVTEPMMRWPMGAQGDLVDRFTRCFDCFLEQALPLGLVYESSGGHGAAVWTPPDHGLDWEQHPWNQPAVHALADDGGHRYEAFWRWVDAHSPGEPLWQLDSIAVDPTWQGRGIGRALIAFGLETARSDGVGAFLSTGTPRNVEIYSRSGFQVVEEASYPAGGPRIWFMRWDPATRGPS